MDRLKFETDLRGLNNYFGMYEFGSESDDVIEFDPTSYEYDESTNTSRHVVTLETYPQETTSTMEECGMNAQDMCIDSFIDSIAYGLKLYGGYIMDEDDVDVYPGWNRDGSMWNIEIHFSVFHK